MLSQQSRYALKALIHMAARNPVSPVPTSEIAEAANIPRKFLEAILLDLKMAGIVYSTRGKAGGYTLSRAPEEITFGEVIRVTDGPLALIHCASQKFYRRCLDCTDEQACMLRKIMIEARNQLSAVLDHRTLAHAIHDGAIDENLGEAPAPRKKRAPRQKAS